MVGSVYSPHHRFLRTIEMRSYLPSYYGFETIMGSFLGSLSHPFSRVSGSYCLTNKMELTRKSPALVSLLIIAESIVPFLEENLFDFSMIFL